MSNTLLKPSGWYLRPLHLVKPDGGIDGGNILEEIIPSPPKSLSPEEEFYIRKWCPVTLNHLLPDLCLTKNYHVEELNEDFDTNMLLRLEKHLEDSHRDVSCDSSTGNEEETEDSNLDGCIENDINMHILQNVKPEPSNKKLLMPHKVNYPDSISMGDWSLPGVVLNNKFPLQPDDNVFSSPYHQRAKIVPKISSEMVNFQFSREEIQRLLLPKKNNKRIPSMQGERTELSYSKTRNKTRKFGVGLPNERQNLSIAAQSAPVPRIEIDSSFADSRSRRDAFFSKPHTLSPLRPHHQFFSTQPSSLCVNHSRSRSLSPFRTTTMHPRAQALPDFSDDLILPSAHLIELARLKREELKLEEKILLRQRTMLEAERLKPPADKWYEMKDFRFHQENHRHNTYLKNERNLPLIQERRRLLIDTLKNSDY